MSYQVEFAPGVYAEVSGKSGMFRVWLEGRWRIVYRIDEELRIVRIIRVRRKEAIDYEGL